MRKYLIYLISLEVVLFLCVPRVDAHILATNGHIGAVLHIDPNDEPIAGSQASFFFEFKDKENKFKAENCDCTFEINENGKNVYSQPLFQNNSKPSLTNASVFYTFPQKDVYEVKIIGKPITPNAFQLFTLTWDFRVDQEATGQSVSPQSSTNFLTTHLVHFIAIGIFLIFFIVYFSQKIINSKKSVQKGGEKKRDEKDSGNIY